MTPGEENIALHYGRDVLDRAHEWCHVNLGGVYSDANLLDVARELATIDAAADAADDAVMP